jgi:hypothetical protein
MAANLVLLTLDRQDFTTLERAAKAGDEAAIAQLSSWWEDYRESVVSCFLCDNDVSWPINSCLLPDPMAPTKLICAPLCLSCVELPRVIKLSRWLKLLKQIYRARTGKRCPAFHFTRPRR